MYLFNLFWFLYENQFLASCFSSLLHVLSHSSYCIVFLICSPAQTSAIHWAFSYQCNNYHLWKGWHSSQLFISSGKRRIDNHTACFKMQSQLLCVFLSVFPISFFCLCRWHTFWPGLIYMTHFQGKHLSTEPEQNTEELTDHHTKEGLLWRKSNTTII